MTVAKISFHCILKNIFFVKHLWWLIPYTYSENLFNTLYIEIKHKWTLFYISNTFINNPRLKLIKNQAKVKQHPKAELLLFENYSLSSFTLSSKNNRRYSKKCTRKQVHLFDGWKMKCQWKWGWKRKLDHIDTT